LTAVGKVLKNFDQTVVEVAGHTDSTGSQSYNQGLSMRRASSVSQYFKSRGILSQRLITVGLGEMRPMASNSSDLGRQANRRVEITLVPVTSG
ncbi:MAG: OmpA family protein, partial [Proteobacteria bacterium]|nr:OmpA family protein [Pseudomonadota bacterium]